MPTKTKKTPHAKPVKTPKAPKAPKLAPIDPKRDAALLMLPSSYAESPDMPVAIAIAELDALHRLATKEARTLARFGVAARQTNELGAYVKELALRERTWTVERDATASAEGKALREEADLLKRKMLAAGEWALRHDEDALHELARIRQGSGLPDTIEDLHQLSYFWTRHAHEMKVTKLTPKDVTRAAELAELLGDAVAEEVSNTQASRARELRNRCFWAATALASEIRQGGRYAFNEEPKTAARFVSRYRQEHNRKARRKANHVQAPAVSPAAPPPSAQPN
jgi:hypothetical protein